METDEMLLWLDLETTGLEPTHDHIVEVAWTATYNDLIGYHDVPIYSSPIDLGADTLDILKSNPYVLEMHSHTRLIDELVTGRTRPLADVEKDVLWLLDEFAKVEEPIYLAGASVHFDLGFIRHWMPDLAQRLSHRVYDTSTLKAFFDDLGIKHHVTNGRQHRASDDVQEVLAVAREYRATIAEMKARP
jgi:oligoribonuclease